MKEIIDRLIKFRDDRDWKQFHTPENLAKSVVLEAAELLENFQWNKIDVDVKNIREEIADIVGYCLLLCEHYNFDITDVLNEKIDLNEKKYPVDKAFGRSDKYNKL